ncbi:MAG: diguanylate cyclase [Anaeromyxobacteraceae bacterium]|jgi:PleD family two-component response regulator|nr:diguanylate cyclase [Anaeromyxobacteraceae bacterium]
MAHRILLLDGSPPLVAALRRFLKGTDLEVQVASPASGLEGIDLAKISVAAVRPASPEGRRAFEALRTADPSLPVVLLLDEEDEPESRLSADGTLVSPLTRTAVVSLFRALARLRAEAESGRALARQVAAHPATLPDYEFFKKLLLVEVKRSRRYHYPVSLALLAVDGWADRAARLDEALRSAMLGEVLALVASGVRDIDLPLLYDAERILVFMPHTDALGARTAADRLVKRARAHPGGLTASVGVASFDGEGTMSFAALVRGAADALLEAQAKGGDQAAHAPARKNRESST